MKSLPKRAESSYIAEMLLLKSDDSIFLVVEDQNLQIIYRNIIRILYDGKLRINKIYSMNSKTGVVNHFTIWKNYSDSIKNSLFIVDRDFDFLKNTKIPKHKNLIELDYYTIENYLIEEEAVINLIRSKVYDEAEIAEKFSWDKWIDYVFTTFEDLFLCYAIAFTYDLKENCSLSPHRYFKKNDSLIDKNKITEYKNELKVSFETQIKQDFNLEYINIRKKFIEKNSVNYHQLIKGKYIIEALLKHLHMVTGKKFDRELTLTLLSTYIEKESMSSIKKKIDRII